jgi:hypothetical protein
MHTGRELFQFQRGGHRVTVVVRGWPRVRQYIGYIDGEERVYASGKGDLMRLLLEMISARPAAQANRGNAAASAS